MDIQELQDEYIDICYEMEEYHALFCRLMTVGSPILSNAIPTAAVMFDRNGKFTSYHFNPEFLEKCSRYDVKFIACHEILHIMLNHGLRGISEKLNRHIVNIAMDIVVNETLFKYFGFDQRKLDCLEDEVCTIQSVFKEKAGEILPDQSTEYYYNKIKENAETIELSGSGDGEGEDGEGEGNGSPGNSPGDGLINNHEHLDSKSKEELKEMLGRALNQEKIAEKIAEAADKQEKGIQAGSEMSQMIFDLVHARVAPKKRWESIVAKIRRKKIEKSRADNYQWAHINRRNVLLSKSLIMPQIAETDFDERHKWDLWLFQDVSGSCIHFYEKFIQAARSIPKDTFNVRFHTFDTNVCQVNLDQDEVPCGGGTSFHIIEEYIQTTIQRTKEKYPRLVWIITDGYGDFVYPKYPKNWTWFLTPHHMTDYIQEGSRKFELSQFADFKDTDY